MASTASLPLSQSDVDDIAARHPEVFKNRPWRRYRAPLAILAVVLYSVYCWSFFGIGKVLQDANWDIAGNYLADWISYEVRPDFEIEPDGAILLEWPRFSPLGSDPDPDWISMQTATMERVRATDGATPAATAVVKPAILSSRKG